MNNGFEGCIQYFKLNEKVFNISFPSNDITNGADIGILTSINKCQKNNFFIEKKLRGRSR